MRPLVHTFALLLLAPALPLGLAAASWWDDAWLDPALLEAHSQEGGSGFIHVPLPQSLPNGLVTGAIHRYRLKLGRGFPHGLEAGGQVELEAWKIDELEKRNLLYARWAPLSPARHGIGLALGVESVGLEDLGLRGLGFLPVEGLEPLDRAYAVAGGPLPKLEMLYLSVGYAGGSARPSAPLGALAFAPFPGVLLALEREAAAWHLGLRMLLSTQIKLDLSLSRMDRIRGDEPFARVLEGNLRFGVSYSERWP